MVQVQPLHRVRRVALLRPELGQDTVIIVPAVSDAEAKEKFAAFVTAVEEFEVASEPIVEVHDSMKELALATKEKAVQQHMADAMGGMQLPPGMKLPF